MTSYMYWIALFLHILEALSWKMIVFGLVLFYVWMIIVVWSVRRFLVRLWHGRNGLPHNQNAQDHGVVPHNQNAQDRGVVGALPHQPVADLIPAGNHGNVPGAGQNALVAAPGTRLMPQIKRHDLKRSLARMTLLTNDLKKNNSMLHSLKDRHKKQRLSLGIQDASSRHMMIEGHQSRQLALANDSIISLHALNAAHAQAHPHPSADELQIHTTAQMQLQKTNHGAENSSQMQFDTDLMELDETHRDQASSMLREHEDEELTFELECLNAHHQAFKQRY